VHVLLSIAVGSIPSPSFNTIGPIHLYGLCIALGVIAAVTISSKRWEARGGNPDDIGTIALWAVPAGVIGARIYHVATDWKTYQDDWIEAFKITNGGLGIPGGVALGVIVGIAVVKAKHLPVRPLLDVVAPAIPVAQAIGRLGNWFNQEVFGRPTDLPWGLEIDPEFRPPQYAAEATFHPTFLYEGIWNLSLAGFLIWLDRKKVLRPGELFGLYVVGYAIGRLWVEMLRSDAASLVLGVRVNIWMSVIVGSVAALIMLWNRRKPLPEPATASAGGAGASSAGSDAEADGAVVPDAAATGSDAEEPADPAGAGSGAGDPGTDPGGPDAPERLET
jgi:prolipoprotein diacylglyceryl transferase